MFQWRDVLLVVSHICPANQKPGCDSGSGSQLNIFHPAAPEHHLGPWCEPGHGHGHLVGPGGIRRIELYAGDFSGERWSSHSAGRVCSVSHEKFRQHLQELGGLATPHLSQPTVYQSNPCILCPLILLQLSCYFTVITHEIKDLSFKYEITSSVIAETYGRRGL